ncbi:MAG: hypothetical protein ACRD3C_00795 [Vicinamibacterales bacterium]
MGSRYFTLAAAAAIVVATLALTPDSGAGQTPAAEEKAWTPPRTPDGQPDIQGFWGNQSRRLATYNIEEAADERHVLFTGNQTDRHSLIVDPPDGKIPYQPWARAKRQDVFDNHTEITKWEHVDPHTRCFLSGVPRMFYQGTIEIVQTPGYVFFLQEFNHGYRVVALDGRPHIGETIKLFMGDSRGRWEGNTLVVDVTNKNDRTWFDMVGDFHSDAVRISERFTVAGPDTIRYEATFEDPKVYTRPFTMALTIGRVARGEAAKTYQLMEEACLEGERNMENMLYKLGTKVEK